MATPAVMEDPQSFLVTSTLEARDGAPCTREQVIHGLASAWRRVAAAGTVRRSLSSSSTSPVPLPPSMSPLASVLRVGDPMPSMRKGGLSPSRLSPTSSLSSFSSSSTSSSGTPTHGRRWQPRWPSFAGTASTRATTIGGDGLNGSAVSPPLASHFSNLPASASSPSVRMQHTARLWSLVANSISSRRANGTIPFMAPSLPVPPLPSSMSAEAAQHMVFSVQHHHYMCLKHSLLLRLQHDKAPVDCVAQDSFSLHELVRRRVPLSESAFILVDLSLVVRQFCAWRYNLPLLEPRFSLHAHADPLILQALTLLGVTVCVSSLADVQALQALSARGYTPLAMDTKACKTPSLLAATLQAGVRVLTVDGDDEVTRIARRAKAMGLVPAALSLTVRMRGPGHKGLALGSTLDLLPSLLATIASHGMGVHGLSIDVRHFAGEDSSAEGQLHAALSFLRRAVSLANTLLDHKVTHVSLLGVDKLMMGAALQALVLLYFPVASGVGVSIDATSHLVDNCTTLVTRIIGKRAAEGGDGISRGFHYYLDDGCYGSLGDVFVHKKKFLPCALSATTGAGELESVHLYPSTLWGPTCDGLDCIDKMTTLPEMDIGDWIYFRNVGSAAFSARTHFNGLTGPKAMHCFTGVGGSTAA